MFLRHEPTRRFTIRLADSVVQRIVAEVGDVAAESLETGGWFWSWAGAGLSDVSIVWANGASRRPHPP